MTTLIKSGALVGIDSIITSAVDGNYTRNKWKCIEVSAGDEEVDVFYAMSGDFECFEFYLFELISGLFENGWTAYSCDAPDVSQDESTGILFNESGECFEVRSQTGKIRIARIDPDCIRLFGTGARSFHIFQSLLLHCTIDDLVDIASNCLDNCNIEDLSYNQLVDVLAMGLCAGHDVYSGGLLVVRDSNGVVCSVHSNTLWERAKIVF